MPFKSQAQREWMHANYPEMAAEWEAETPQGKKLPKRIGDDDEKSIAAEVARRTLRKGK